MAQQNKSVSNLFLVQNKEIGQDVKGFIYLQRCVLFICTMRCVLFICTRMCMFPSYSQPETATEVATNQLVDELHVREGCNVTGVGPRPIR